MSILFNGLKSGFTVAALLVAAAQVDDSPASFMQAMHSSMQRMDRDMAAAPMNGDADHDFAAMMMPHHHGAIEMAKVELIYGKNLVMRRLAQEIVVEQQSEIQAIQLWLSKGRAPQPRGEQ